MNDKNIIKVSHELNHFRGGYTRLELDFIFAFISTIKDEDEDFRPYTLTLPELSKKLGRELRLRDTEYMFDSLIRKSFKINNEEKLAVYAFFVCLEFDKTKSSFTVEFNPKLKPHLLDLYHKVTNQEGRLFAKGDLRYILELRSEYSKRMYMLLVQWKSIRKVVHDVDDLRDMLDVPKSYGYGQFKQKVLVPAYTELLKTSDIFFEYEEIKAGRKVTEILFRIKTKSGAALDAPVQDPSLKELIGKEIYYDGYDWTITDLTNEHGDSIHAILTGDRVVKPFQFTKSQLIKMVEAKSGQGRLF